MLYIIDSCTDPYWNLAAEEYMLKNFTEPIFRLWRNDNAIIVGHYQNTIAEIDVEYVKSHKIKVVRRLTGGGAVFHDLGNLNFTFIEKKIEGEDSSAMFKRFTAPIIEALNSMGVKAYLEGRNDLLIDGKKFSGNAVCVHKERILQHGTLLFSAFMPDLANALKTRPEKFQGKAVQSNRSRVTNISDHLKATGDNRFINMDVEGFKEYLGNYICKNYIGNEEHESQKSKNSIIRYDYSKTDIKNITALKEQKYALDSWNFGNSPSYSFNKSIKFAGGIMELFMAVEKGAITNIEIFGDYFFTKPTEEFIAELMKPGKEGKLMHNREAIELKLSEIDMSGYFNNISKEEILSLFF